MSAVLTAPELEPPAAATGALTCLLEDGLSPGRRFEAPRAILRAKDARLTLAWDDGRTEAAFGDPFRHLEGLLRRYPELTAAGYWGYDLRHHLERLPQRAVDDLGLPDLCVGLYAGQRRCDDPLDDFTPVAVRPAFSAVSRAEYETAVRRVKDYIAAGDCYQVNLSQRFTAAWPWTPERLYQRLRHFTPAPYSAYLDAGDFQVLSSSPELFLRVRDGVAETRPIKGTRPRGATVADDARLAAELLSSAKDQAELVMIVDLERNDLGKVCDYGSVETPDLVRLESFSNVHHLVSTVRGRLREGVGPLECLRAAFPGGSITGAPKVRAMEIIEELEPYRRGVYTGAIGWVDGRGNAEWSIAIRTITLVRGHAHFHVGGGIVADSDPAAEYEETLTKAQGMLAALGATVGAVR